MSRVDVSGQIHADHRCSQTHASAKTSIHSDYLIAVVVADVADVADDSLGVAIHDVADEIVVQFVPGRDGNFAVFVVDDDDAVDVDCVDERP